MDLILRHANLPDGRIDHDIGIRDGRIVAVEPTLTASAAEEIDVRGRLVSPPNRHCSRDFARGHSKLVCSHPSAGHRGPVTRRRCRESGVLANEMAVSQHRITLIMKHVIVSREIAGRTLTLETGKVAKLCNAAIIAT